MPSSPPHVSRRKNRSPKKNPSPADNGIPGGGRKVSPPPSKPQVKKRALLHAVGHVCHVGHSRSFPVTSRKRSPRARKEPEFKNRSRRNRSSKPKPLKSYHRRSRKVTHSHRKVVAIYTASQGHKSISYVRKNGLL